MTMPINSALKLWHKGEQGDYGRPCNEWTQVANAIMADTSDETAAIRAEIQRRRDTNVYVAHIARHGGVSIRFERVSNLKAWGYYKTIKVRGTLDAAMVPLSKIVAQVDGVWWYRID